jgi:hypothetical protein
MVIVATDEERELFSRASAHLPLELRPEEPLGAELRWTDDEGFLVVRAIDDDTTHILGFGYAADAALCVRLSTQSGRGTVAWYRDGEKWTGPAYVDGYAGSLLRDTRQ